MKSLGANDWYIKEAELYKDLYLGRISSQYKDFIRLLRKRSL